MSSLPAITSQTVGPYFMIGLKHLIRSDLASPGASGEPFTLQGRVLDANRKPIPDALIEIWQADANGRYRHPEDKQDKPLDPNFFGFGRVATNENGAFSIRSIRPGAVPAPGGGTQAPHLSVSIFMRGLLTRLTTRVYFPDEPLNANDPILNLVPSTRRATIIAKKTERDILHWDVLMQGEDETVFFDV